MQYTLLLGAVTLLSAKAEAAPKAADEHVVAHVVQGRNLRPDPQSGEWTYPVAARGRSGFHFNGTTNSTSPAGTGTAGAPGSTYILPHNTTSSTSSFRASGCPQSVVTSTTTVDVTFYITATTSYGGNLTSSRGTGTVLPPSSSSHTLVNSTSSRAFSNTSSSSIRLSTGYTLPINSSHVSTTVYSTASSESPCPDETTSTHQPHPNITSGLSSQYSGSSLVTGDSSGTTTSVPVWHNTTSAAPSQITEPCDDDLSSTSRFHSSSAAFSTLLNSTALWSTKTSTNAAEETPCDDGTSSASVTATYASTTHANQMSSDNLSNKTQNGTFSQTVRTVSTSSSVAASSTSSATLSSSWTTSTPTVTPFLGNTSSTASSAQTTTTPTNPSLSPIPTESCVIDTSMVPITSAPLTSAPTSTLIPTKTVCQDDAPTGRPKPGNNHCGVHGLPVGNYFLARFVENAPGVPVTLEGCYQFCASVMNATDGCKAYRFYPERGLNVPRCDLYGSSVAYALDSINNDHPDMWFDLTCGSPSDKRWVHLSGMTRLRELGLLE